MSSGIALLIGERLLIGEWVIGERLMIYERLLIGGRLNGIRLLIGGRLLIGERFANFLAFILLDFWVSGSAFFPNTL